METCVHNQDNSAQCNDMRKPVGEQNYERTDLTNYLCTNSLDYNSMYDYMNKLRADLIKCESGKK